MRKKLMVGAGEPREKTPKIYLLKVEVLKKKIMNGKNYSIHF